MFAQSLESSILKAVLCAIAVNTGEYYVPAAVSGRHIHLTYEAIEVLFGSGYELTPLKGLSQPGQYACKETLTVSGRNGTIKNVRILGPARKKIQVELSKTDCIAIGVSPYIRQSGDIDGTEGAELIGTHGSITMAEGVIVAARHMHLSKEQAETFKLSDGEIVCLEKKGERPTSFGGFITRVSDRFEMEAHIDTDEANAADINTGDLLQLRRESRV